jgi:hypothetical protein
MDKKKNEADCPGCPNPLGSFSWSHGMDRQGEQDGPSSGRMEDKREEEYTNSGIATSVFQVEHRKSCPRVPLSFFLLADPA